jgi:hypothetical protein
MSVVFAIIFGAQETGPQILLDELRKLLQDPSRQATQAQESEDRH